jgi:hypothetical protein
MICLSSKKHCVNNCKLDLICSTSLLSVREGRVLTASEDVVKRV